MRGTSARTVAGWMVSAVLSAAIGAPALAGGVVIYVDDDAPPGGDGLSWTTAFRFLQDALDYANQGQNGVTEVRVGQGVYKPDHDELNPNGTGNRFAYFSPSPFVPILGGYAGVGAADPDARDVAAFETILSGDLAGDDEPNFANRDDNSKAVIYSENAKLDGCTIRSGVRGISSEGVTITDSKLIDNSSAIHGEMKGGHIDVRKCVFESNHGGIFVDLDSASVEDSEFRNQDGGTIAALESGVSVRRSKFVNNNGGAWFLTSSAYFEDCEFTGNSDEFGAAAYFAPDLAERSSGRFVNCQFRHNTAVSGGAIYSKGHPARDNELLLQNCVFFDNVATLNGGATFSMYCQSKVVNCTFVRNAAMSGGGMFNTSSAHAFVYNSIVKGNYGKGFGGPGLRTVRYSNIGGGHPGLGNIDVNPKFVDYPDGDLRLKPSSPCIDAGRNSYLPESIAIDVDGKPRFVDRPQTPDTGFGTAPIVDMGAFEFQP